MENSLVTCGFNKNREGIVSGLSGYLYELNSAQSSGKKIIGNVTAKNHLKENLFSILCFIIQRKVSSGKRLIVAYGNLTRLGLLF